MALKKAVSSGPVEPQQEEMTVVVVKFKGGPESMQKGFDAVNNAIAALGPAQPNSQRVIVQRTPAKLSPPLAQDDQVLDAEIEEPNTAESENVAPAPEAPASTPKPRKPYTFISEFNLSPAGVPSLKEYCTAKKPQNDSDKCLVAGAWIQTHGGIDPFTGRHLFTAFRAMEWKTQSDMTQPMRLLKSKKSYFDNPSSGKWRLTGIGLEAAEKFGS
jgi:hypothetical protein